MVFAVDALGGGGADAAVAGRIAEHPGDTAPPRVVLKWLDSVEATIGGTAFGVLLYDEVPAALKRSTEPVDVEDYPVLRVDAAAAGVTPAMVASRTTERRRVTSETRARLPNALTPCATTAIGWR